MNSRRSFMWKLGAGASAALASVAGNARGAAPAADDPALRAALLEEERALRQIHQAFEAALDQGRYEDVIGMFTGDAEVVFNGGVFSQRRQGVSRLYREQFPAGRSGARMPAAPGFEVPAAEHRDVVTVSADRLSAEAYFPYSIQVGTPLEADCSLAAMAKLHGEGMRTWWEGGNYKVGYRKDAASGAWQISRLVYDTLSRADYRAGRSYAAPIAATRFARRFPADPHGPDELVRG